MTPPLPRPLRVRGGRDEGGSCWRMMIQKASELITSPLLRVPSAHQVRWLIESLMNLTLPSVIMTLTPPGCQLSEFEKLLIAPELVKLQLTHKSFLSLGTTTVLKSVMSWQPCAQFSPRCLSRLPPDLEFQALSQAAIEAMVPVGLADASSNRLAAEIPVTLVNPIRFCPSTRLWFPTTHSANPMVLLVPSITSRMP